VSPSQNHATRGGPEIDSFVAKAPTESSANVGVLFEYLFTPSTGMLHW
jgi:hypothetical protein